ncbi:MAG: hypothetical protein M1819_005923 [Sarea resinae]|nr:MAG: hypothetical protein M1819_005923 [Sarea resinae]
MSSTSERDVKQAWLPDDSPIQTGDTRSKQPGNVFLYRLRHLVILGGLISFSAWLLVGYWTHWTGTGSWCRAGKSCFGASLDAASRTSRDEHFQWRDITPTKHLVYHPCESDFECARLEVPLDWNRTDGKGASVALAITRLPAKVPVTDPRYGGVILQNPGGPGGSGISMMWRVAKDIQTIVDSEIPVDSNGSLSDERSAKYFDILSWDPRGVNNTTPSLSCFPDSYSRSIWQHQVEADGVLGSSESSFVVSYARAKANAEGCSKIAAGEESIGRFMSTPPVIADMVEIIERHGEWRERQANKWLSSPKGILATTGKPSSSPYSREQVIERTRWREGEEQLQYWGLSYGTVIGATFATLQPHRVGTAVLDGAVDTDDYYEGGWTTNLHDSDEMFHKFYEHCFNGGPDECPFYHSGGPKAIEATLESILASLKSQPLPVPASATRGPEIITYSDLKRLIFQTVYSPLKRFPILAQVLADLVHENTTSVADLKYKSRSPPYPSRNCRDALPYDPSCMIPGENSEEASTGILCADGAHADLVSPGAFKAYWQMLQKQSKTLGDSWAALRLFCSGWTAEPKWRFKGTTGADTANPILYIGNTRDPVTPLRKTDGLFLRSAHKMASRFNSSIVLTQDSEGHCSISSPSLCSAKAIRAYFQTSVLPAPDTVCAVEALPFMPSSSSSSFGPGNNDNDSDDDNDGDDDNGWGEKKKSQADRILLAALRSYAEKFL